MARGREGFRVNVQRGLTVERLALILAYSWPHRTIEKAA
jgi:hypothetical protein